MRIPVCGFRDAPDYILKLGRRYWKMKDSGRSFSRPGRRTLWASKLLSPKAMGSSAKSKSGRKRTSASGPWKANRPNRRWRLKPPVIKAGGITSDLLREKSTLYFKKLIGDTLKIPYQKLDAAEPYGRYGIDSILVVQLANTLSKVLNNVNSTLFFEYQTIDELVDHFLKTQSTELIKLVGLENQESTAAVLTDDRSPALPPTVTSLPTFRKSRSFLPPQITEPNSPAYSRGGALIRDVAVIGLAGRYPGAENVQEFWNLLKEGKNCITEIPEERWDWREYFDAEKGKEGTTYTKWGGFIKDIDKFDPLFFHISPKEAEMMDPQERLFLETAYASIEDSGYTPATLCDNHQVGVFVGVLNGNYPTGPNFWSVANRISYLLNFHGPSMAVDTACSSSLTALHLALESLYSGTSECAIAGGVNLIEAPVHYLRLSFANMLSPGDRCQSFGEGADGIVDSEGVGASS